MSLLSGAGVDMSRGLWTDMGRLGDGGRSQLHGTRELVMVHYSALTPEQAYSIKGNCRQVDTGFKVGYLPLECAIFSYPCMERLGMDRDRKIKRA